jgi:hypothetical protein
MSTCHIQFVRSRCLGRSTLRNAYLRHLFFLECCFGFHSVHGLRLQQLVQKKTHTGNIYIRSKKRNQHAHRGEKTELCGETRMPKGIYKKKRKKGESNIYREGERERRWIASDGTHGGGKKKRFGHGNRKHKHTLTRIGGSAHFSWLTIANAVPPISAHVRSCLFPSNRIKHASHLNLQLFLLSVSLCCVFFSDFHESSPSSFSSFVV